MNISQIRLYPSNSIPLSEQKKHGGKLHNGFSNNNIGAGATHPAHHIQGVRPFTR